ncbi:MAG: hypothetical protein M0Q19_05130 [Candidatus Cloacimonetes bacterium]|nr:hypothetical protein [Candidatus Cloacimonadota bacterium]MCK9332546.1 hypothetical protein [Candidatus Cloacimonadota bacterium]
MKVKLNVKYGKNMPSDIIELDEKKATYLIDNGFAVEAKGATTPTNDNVSNEDIIDSLDLTEDEKLYLLDNLGDLALATKKDGTLTAKSEKDVEAILAGLGE